MNDQRATARLRACRRDVALNPEGGTKGGGLDVSAFTPGPLDPGPGLHSNVTVMIFAQDDLCSRGVITRRLSMSSAIGNR